MEKVQQTGQVFSPQWKRRPSINGGGQGVRNRSLVITLAMAFIMLGSVYAALPAPMHNLSSVDPTHASLHDGATGEGPFSDTRSASERAAYLDILLDGDRFEGPSGEAVDVTFNLTERNNVGISLTSFAWSFKTLEGDTVIDGGGSAPCAIDLEGLGSTEWTTSITISTRLYTRMMEQGRDQLRLTITFRGIDDRSNSHAVSRNIPAHLTQRVAMLVDEDIYDGIKDNMARFETDANLRGSVEFIYRTGDWSTPEAIRTLLKQLWRDEGITGAMLWGYLPYAMWRLVHTDGKNEDFPIPVFYEDMDGDFIDVNSDGLYDKHIWGANDGNEIWVSHIMPPMEVVPEAKLDPSGQGTGGGLQAKYYNQRNFNNLRLTRVDPTIDFYWERDLPEEITRSEFTVKWTGRIRAVVSEMYTLTSQHGGGARLYIDGTQVHNQWNGITWNVTEWLVDVYLTQGWHDIRLEYNHNNWGFNGANRLLWSSDTILAKTINDWLNTSHAYHNGELVYNERALLFFDYGYGIKSRMKDPILANQIQPLYGDNVMVAGCTNTTDADDYIEALDKGHELVSVWSHSGSSGHHISYDERPDGINVTGNTYKIRETEAGLVTLIWGCHAGDYGNKGPGTSLLSDNLAVNYAFNTPYGLASAGSTRSIGSTFREVYWAWEKGSSMATGIFAYMDFGYNQTLMERRWPAGGTDRWVEDFVFLGDPFIRIDHKPWDLSMNIEGGSELTTDPDVTLHINAVNADEMRFKNAGGAWSAWETYSTTKEWTIGSAFGAHRVYAQVRNDWGIADYLSTDVITLIATASDWVSLEIDGGAEMTASHHVTVSLDIGDADPAMVWMSLRDDGTAWSDWSPFIDTTGHELSKGDGERTVYVKFISDDEYWQSETSDSIIVDTLPPVSSAILSGELGMMDWYVSPVSVELSSTDGLTGVEATEWSLNGGEWTPYVGALQVPHEGLNELRYRSRDACGNVEGIKTVTFQLDTSSPSDMAIAMAEGGDLINLPSIEVTLNAKDHLSGIEGMRFSVDGDDWGPWINYETSRYMVIPSEDGTHTIDWQVRDIAGNVASVPFPLEVVLDTKSPTVSTATPEEDSGGNAVDTKITVTFDEPINEGTLTGVNFLVQNSGGIPVMGELDYDDGTGELQFVPSDELDLYTTYNVMLRGEIADKAGNGLNGGLGHMWSFTTIGVAPGAPHDLTATATDDSILLAWRAPENMGSGQFQGYNVYRMMDDGQPDQDFEFLASVVGIGFEDTDVDAIVQYHYKVMASSSYAEGVESLVASAVIIPTVEDPDDDPEDPDDPIGPGPNGIPDPVDVDTTGKLVGTYAVIVIVVVAVVMLLSIMLVRRKVD
jgi:hypothetical protein